MERKSVFLTCLSIVYLFVFVSIFVQIPGLFGNNGIVPARAVLQKETNSVEEFILNKPSLLRIVNKLGLNLDIGLDFIAVGGIIISIASLVSKMNQTSFVYFLLWFFYLSLVQVGQSFLTSIWDLFLLETGFLSIFLAPLGLFGSYVGKKNEDHSNKGDNINQKNEKKIKSSKTHYLILWSLKWLLFRFLISNFFSKVNQVYFYCPRKNIFSPHLASCIKTLNNNINLPTPLFLVFDFLPSSLVAVVTTINLTCLFFTTIMVLIPSKLFNNLSFVYIFSSTLINILFENQGYYPFLVITISVLLLDDNFLNNLKRKTEFYLSGKSTRETTETCQGTPPIPVLEILIGLSRVALLLVIILSTVILYGFPEAFSFFNYFFLIVNYFLVNFLMFIREKSHLVTMTMAIIGFCFLLNEIWSGCIRLWSIKRCVKSKKTLIIVKFVFFTVLCSFLFTLSLIPLFYNDQTSQIINKQNKNSIEECKSTNEEDINYHSEKKYGEEEKNEEEEENSLEEIYMWLHKNYFILNNYYYFMKLDNNNEVMKRLEIILKFKMEEENEEENDWLEYDFYFKPGHVESAPSFNGPYNPRLEEALLFAASSNYKQNPFIINLVYRLLNNQQEVLDLLKWDSEIKNRPKYIKVDLYQYEFNHGDFGSDWWKRKWVGHYLPMMWLEENSFQSFIQEAGLELKESFEGKSVCSQPNLLSLPLTSIRSLFSQTNGSFLSLFLLAVGIILSFFDSSGSSKRYISIIKRRFSGSSD